MPCSVLVVCTYRIVVVAEATMATGDAMSPAVATAADPRTPAVVLATPVVADTAWFDCIFLAALVTLGVRLVVTYLVVAFEVFPADPAVGVSLLSGLHNFHRLNVRRESNVRRDGVGTVHGRRQHRHRLRQTSVGIVVG